jgi:anti-sigma regulatory factor (Ser/Thr protein kinase)
MRQVVAVERVPVQTDDDVLVAVQTGVQCARRLGFASVQTTEHLRLILSELGTNLVRHAGGGALRISALLVDDEPQVLVESYDLGGGIDSTAGSATGLGLGLNMVARHSAEFTLSSEADVGTRLQAVIPWR